MQQKDLFFLLNAVDIRNMLYSNLKGGWGGGRGLPPPILTGFGGYRVGSLKKKMGYFLKNFNF
jgi:hypothetical protein